mmetsp:Transcript_40764/g.65445  ORF Transcript_40764/g.65445 Transcript_40764/m.65445 type:complete len:94 (-) Transcript_40764:980-1261(-)
MRSWGSGVNTMNGPNEQECCDKNVKNQNKISTENRTQFFRIGPSSKRVHGHSSKQTSKRIVKVLGRFKYYFARLVSIVMGDTSVFTTGAVLKL